MALKYNKRVSLTTYRSTLSHVNPPYCSCNFALIYNSTFKRSKKQQEKEAKFSKIQKEHIKGN